jgi:acyl-CoA synthetase (NDP forming)
MVASVWRQLSGEQGCHLWTGFDVRSGGVFVEVLKDVSFRILPVTEADIEEMVKEIKGYNLLRGYRGTAVDLSA